MIPTRIPAFSLKGEPGYSGHQMPGATANLLRQFFLLFFVTYCPDLVGALSQGWAGE